MVLLALSHGPLRIAAPGNRFIFAVAITWLLWIAAIIAIAPGWVDWLTGALLLATATLAGFTLWTLVAWGFTVSMLVALCRSERRLSEEEWALAYTGGKPLAAFTRDRLGVLLKLRLAEVQGDQVVMSPRRGLLFAKATTFLRNLFGV